VAFKTKIGIAALALTLALSGCGAGKPAPDAVDPSQTGGGIAGVGGAPASTIGDLQLFDRFGDGSSGGDLGVNKYLWKASLDTLAFLPIISTDPFSGVIATDWGLSATAPNERFKVTAYITDVKLEARSLKVAVFREVKGDNGWAPAAVDPATPRKIEDSILTRARMIKIEDIEANG
jgi:hypothetical protein